jgi:hypothetical protein
LLFLRATGNSRADLGANSFDEVEHVVDIIVEQRLSGGRFRGHHGVLHAFNLEMSYLVITKYLVNANI